MTVCRRYARDLHEAEDILQEAFIRIFKNVGQYRFEGSLEGWIRRIVVHTALRVLQTGKVRLTEMDEQIGADHPVDAEALTALHTEELLKLVSALPDGYRIVFNLYVLEGYDHNEIAAMLKITAGTSRSQLAKARRLLQTQIENLQKLPDSYVAK